MKKTIGLPMLSYEASLVARGETATLTEEQIQQASDELYQKLVVETGLENGRDVSKYRPAEEVFAEKRKMLEDLLSEKV